MLQLTVKRWLRRRDRMFEEKKNGKQHIFNTMILIENYRVEFKIFKIQQDSSVKYRFVTLIPQLKKNLTEDYIRLPGEDDQISDWFEANLRLEIDTRNGKVISKIRNAVKESSDAGKPPKSSFRRPNSGK